MQTSDLERWSRYFDPTYQAHYYVHELTGKSQWDPPNSKCLITNHLEGEQDERNVVDATNVGIAEKHNKEEPTLDCSRHHGLKSIDSGESNFQEDGEEADLNEEFNLLLEKSCRLPQTNTTTGNTSNTTSEHAPLEVALQSPYGQYAHGNLFQSSDNSTALYCLYGGVSTSEGSISDAERNDVAGAGSLQFKHRQLIATQLADLSVKDQRGSDKEAANKNENISPIETETVPCSSVEEERVGSMLMRRQSSASTDRDNGSGSSKSKSILAGRAIHDYDKDAIGISGIVSWVSRKNRSKGRSIIGMASGRLTSDDTNSVACKGKREQSPVQWVGSGGKEGAEEEEEEEAYPKYTVKEKQAPALVIIENRSNETHMRNHHSHQEERGPLKHDYFHLARRYKYERDFSNPHAEITCLLCHENLCEDVFFPCEHRCVCRVCLELENICDEQAVITGRIPAQDAYCLCSLCSGVIKLILPSEGGLEVEKYWDWVYEDDGPNGAEHQLSLSFRRNFKHSAAVIRSVYLEGGDPDSIENSGLCTVS